MQMHDRMNSNINLNSMTLREVDMQDGFTIRVSYILNTVKMTNKLEYNLESNARQDYNAIVEMIGGKATFLTE
jgi:hypothetical protein